MFLTLFRRLGASFLLLLVAAALHAQVGQWTYKAHMLSPRSECAVASGTDGKIYVFGGHDGNQDVKTAEVYDPASDSWSAISDMPAVLLDAAAVAGPDERIYLFGLIEGSETAYIYNPSTDSYSSGGPINTGYGSVFEAALGNDGNLIVITTFPAYSPTPPQLFTYALAAFDWQYYKPVFTATSPAVTSDASGLVYVAGGFVTYRSSLTKAAFTYDDHTHAWTELAPMAHARDNPASSLGGDGRIYVFGGSDGPGAGLPYAEAYDPVSGGWTTVAPLNTARAMHGGARDAAGRIYAIGGNIRYLGTGGRVLDTVECYQPSMLLGNGKSITSTEGNEFSGEVASFRDMGPAQSAANYTATVYWGDGPPTAATVADGATPGTFIVTGTHTYQDPGTYATTIQIADSEGDALSVLGQSVVYVAPLTGDGIDFGASSNVAFTKTLAHFTYGNPLETGENLTAKVTWGDGSAMEDATLIANPGGGFDVQGSHTYLTPDSYGFVVWIFRSGLGQSLTGTATITPPAPVVAANSISTVEGSLFSGPVGTFTSADPSLSASSFAATVEWGDGSSSVGIVTSDGAGGFKVDGSHTYLLSGSYLVQVSVLVAGGGTGSGNAYATVSNAPLNAVGFNLTCKGTKFANTVATFTDGNPYSSAGDFAAEIFWGDGKSSPGTVVAAGAGFKVVGSHAYLKRGRYTVSITIRDAQGATANAITQINVGPVK